MPQPPVMHNSELIERIRKGALFIFPTDAGYCIGCNALRQIPLKRLKELKFGRIELLTPSKEWLKKNFIIKKAYLEILPGPFVYILKPRPSTKLKGFDEFRVRMPSHPFMKIIADAKVPVAFAEIIPVTDLKKLPHNVAASADLVIDLGILEKSLVTTIDLRGKLPKVVLE